jgi:transcriptional regulator with XRE-family HTH domain
MIAVIRDSIRLSQANLGEQLGVSHAAISDIERGKTSIGLERLEKLASILRINPRDLL